MLSACNRRFMISNTSITPAAAAIKPIGSAISLDRGDPFDCPAILKFGKRLIRHFRRNVLKPLGRVKTPI